MHYWPGSMLPGIIANMFRHRTTETNSWRDVEVGSTWRTLITEKTTSLQWAWIILYHDITTTGSFYIQFIHWIPGLLRNTQQKEHTCLIVYSAVPAPPGLNSSLLFFLKWLPTIWRNVYQHTKMSINIPHSTLSVRTFWTFWTLVATLPLGRVVSKCRHISHDWKNNISTRGVIYNLYIISSLQ